MHLSLGLIVPSRHHGLCLVLLLFLGCTPGKKAKQSVSPVGRFAAVASSAKTGAVHDPAGFCEKTYPNSGPQVKSFVWPPLKPLPGQTGTPKIKTEGRWVWLNLWATWCKPCMAEMALLGRWAKSLNAEGLGIDLRLMTIDEPSAGHALANQIERGLPGPTIWLRGRDDFVPFLAHLGLDSSAAIPIHVLIDPSGKLRCVRVGVIHDVDFAAVKGIIRGG